MRRPRSAWTRRCGLAAVTGAIAGGRPDGPKVRGVRESLGDEVIGGGGGGPDGAGGVRPGYTPTGQRIGRNDPGHCGSGQKYKKCHGR